MILLSHDAEIRAGRVAVTAEDGKKRRAHADIPLHTAPPFRIVTAQLKQ
jgi:hypothetical protein